MMAGQGNRRGSGRREASGGEGAAWLDDWIAVEPDGTIAASSGKVEIGTGTRTALAQIVAEELDVPFEKVRLTMGDTGRTPDEGYTAGSMTILSSGTALREAAAEARQALLELASELLDSLPDELEAHDGMIAVKGDPQRSISYAQLMGGQKFNRPVTGEAPKKNPQAYRIVGTSTPRVDLPAKVTGQPSFVEDLRIPGMLHARLVRPPNPGARLVSVDARSVETVPGLVQVVQQGNFVGVVAEHEEQAVLAAGQLKVEWQTDAVFPPQEDLYTYLRAHSNREDRLVERGDVEQRLRGASRKYRAVYSIPFQAHASLGPSCAIAEVQSNNATIWSSTTGPYPLRGALAELLGLPEEQVRIIHVEGAAGYGHSGADDAAGDAVILSRAVGKPVRLQWSRQDEFIWEPKAPAVVVEVQGGLDAQGNVVAWDYHIWSPTQVSRPRGAGGLLAQQLVSGVVDPPPQWYFGAERNAPTNYAFPVQRVTVHWVEKSPLRASAFRSLGGAANTFANESFMDELAAAVGVDALEFRLRYLKDERAREALQAAAAQANWDPHPSPGAKQEGLAEGRGVAFAWYENDQALVACVARVQVDPASGEVRVKRIVVAHDCGLIINPDGLQNQIEGNVIQSLSRSLKEEVMFTESAITSVDWETYPILKFSEVPDIEVVLINRPNQPAVGAGEPSTITTAAAVANAIFDATGKRLRQIPFTPERVRAA